MVHLIGLVFYVCIYLSQYPFFSTVQHGMTGYNINATKIRKIFEISKKMSKNVN